MCNYSWPINEDIVFDPDTIEMFPQGRGERCTPELSKC